MLFLNFKRLLYLFIILKNVHPSFCYDSLLNSYVFNTCKSAWFSKKCHIFSAHPFFMNYVKQYATCKDISHNFLQPTNIQKLLDLNDRVYWGLRVYVIIIGMRFEGYGNLPFEWLINGFRGTEYFSLVFLTRILNNVDELQNTIYSTRSWFHFLTCFWEINNLYCYLYDNSLFSHGPLT